MTYDEYVKACECEFNNGFGDVTEIRVDQRAYDELVISLGKPSVQPSGLVNPITGSESLITIHKNHLVVARVLPTRHVVIL